MQRAPQLPADEGDDQRAHRCRNAAEEVEGPFGEIVLVEPARIDQRPIEIVLRHFLEGPSDRPLLGRHSLVEVDLILPFQVPADESRIGNPLAIIVDVRQLALRRLAKAGSVRPVSEAGHFQEHLGLGDERTWIRHAESGPECVERDHR